MVQRVNLVTRALEKIAGSGPPADRLKESPLRALKDFYCFKGKPNFYFYKVVSPKLTQE